MAEDKKDAKPAIIIKKGGHGGHHGGAWKIAYADFTTAMMCFFLCMWLINTASVTTRQAIASYFRKPSIFQEGSGQPLLLGGQGILSDAYIPPREKDNRKFKKPDEDQKTYGETNKDLDKLYIQEAKVAPIKHRGPTEQTGLNSDRVVATESRKEIRLRILAEETKQQIERLMATGATATTPLGKVQVSVEPDGLKIEIMDTDTYSMFDSGSARIRSDAEPSFKKVTEVIRRYPNTIDIIGHTDAHPFSSNIGGYTNWELSADRANAARRLLEKQGFQSEKIKGVIGKASSELRLPDKPFDSTNRRITLKLRFDSTQELFKDINPSESYNDPLKNLLLSETTKQVPPTPETPVAQNTPGKLEPPPTSKPDSASADTPVAALATPVTNLVQIPDTAPSSNPDYMPADKIFGDNPVLGLGDL